MPKYGKARITHTNKSLYTKSLSPNKSDLKSRTNSYKKPNRFSYSYQKSSYNKSSKTNNRQRLKYNAINFQLIALKTVQISANFYMPSYVIDIFRKYRAVYNKEDKAYLCDFGIYPDLIRDLKEIIEKSKEYKNSNNDIEDIVITPIPSIAVSFLVNKGEIGKCIQFQGECIDKSDKKGKSRSNKCTKYKAYTIVYDDEDENKDINSLPPSFSPLYQFQREGVLFGIKKKGRLLLADEMGVGKSAQALGICQMFKDSWPVLIICPSFLKSVWEDEVKKWIKGSTLQVISKSSDYIMDNRNFYIVSYDMSVRINEKLIAKKFQIAVVDEAHYLKSRDSKRSKILVPILQQCKRPILLTGTPILARPCEIYNILKILRPDKFKGFKEFADRYCDPKRNAFGMDYTGAANIKELSFILNYVMIRRLKKDVLSQLPPKKRQKIEISTDEKIIKQIIAITANNMASLEDIAETYNSSNYVHTSETDFLVSTKNSHNNFVSNSGLNNPSLPNQNKQDILSLFLKVYSLTGQAKIPGIKEYVGYLAENGCKFLIFAHHTIVLDAIEDEIKKKKVEYIRIDGKTDMGKRQILVNKFQQEKDVRVAILSITACGTGLTLTASSTVVFAELHLTPSAVLQAEDRVHRIGQERSAVNIHFLVAKDTLDDIIFKRLNKKFNIISEIFDKKKGGIEAGRGKGIGEFYKEKENYEYKEIDEKNIKKDRVVLKDGGINGTLNNFIVVKKDNEENDNKENEFKYNNNNKIEQCKKTNDKQINKDEDIVKKNKINLSSISTRRKENIVPTNDLFTKKRDSLQNNINSTNNNNIKDNESQKQTESLTNNKTECKSAENDSEFDMDLINFLSEEELNSITKELYNEENNETKNVKKLYVNNNSIKNDII